MTKIGIFWIFRGSIFGAAQEPEEGIESLPGIIDSRLEHASTWDRVHNFSNLFEELADLEYYSVPRGRVLLKNGRVALIYLDQSLINSRSAKSLISEFFGVSPDKVQWVSDPHYATDEATIESLFE